MFHCFFYRFFTVYSSFFTVFDCVFIAVFRGAQHVAHYGRVCRMNRLFVKALHYDNSGGAVDDRTDEKEQRKIVLPCFVYTCQRLIDLSLSLCIYMPAIDRPRSDCRYDCDTSSEVGHGDYTQRQAQGQPERGHHVREPCAACHQRSVFNGRILISH